MLLIMRESILWTISDSREKLPKEIENVPSFLGLTSYYRPFMKAFAELASPSTQLLKKDVSFYWYAAQERSFQNLKEVLVSAPVLGFPDFIAPFHIYIYRCFFTGFRISFDAER